MCILAFHTALICRLLPLNHTACLRVFPLLSGFSSRPQRKLEFSQRSRFLLGNLWTVFGVWCDCRRTAVYAAETLVEGVVGAPWPPVSSHRGLVPCSFPQMMRFSWQNYRRYAMGKNELRPLTKDGFEGSMFGELTQTSGASSASVPAWALPSFSGLRGPECSCPLLHPHFPVMELGKVRMARDGEHGRLGKSIPYGRVMAGWRCLQRERICV